MWAIRIAFNKVIYCFVLQEFVEHNIRQLVLDDEDVQADPAIVKSRQIPKVNLEISSQAFN